MIDPCITPFDFGAVGDGVTDDSAAFAAMAAAYRNAGGRMVIPAFRYNLPLTATLDFRRNIPGIGRYDIDATGAVLDFSQCLMTSGAMLRFGATGGANINELGHYRVRGGSYIGPLTTVIPESGMPTYATCCIDGEWMFNGKLDDVVINGFHRGVRMASSWPFSARGVFTMNCGTGLLLQENMTRATWVDCSFRNGRFGVVAYPSVSGGSIYGQTFIGLLLEGNAVGCVLDPRDGPNPLAPATGAGLIRSFTFDSPYLESILYDAFRVGKSWTESNAAADGANRYGRSDQLVWRNGIWDGAWNTTTKTAIKFNDAAGSSPGKADRVLIDCLPAAALNSINRTAATMVSVRP